eukprot:12606632-Ditylum_brightwellii.AAC.1
MKLTKTTRFHSWKIRFGVHIQAQMHGGIAWVVIDKIEDLMLDWSHLPKEQMNGKVLPPAWVGRPHMEWMEGVSEAEKQ